MVKDIAKTFFFIISSLLVCKSGFTLPAGCLHIGGFGSDFKIETTCPTNQLADFKQCVSCNQLTPPPLILKKPVAIQYYPPGCKPIQRCDAERNCIQLEYCN